MVNADTDFGGVRDGAEDTNHDGALDLGETDPGDEIDDVAVAGCARGDTDCDGMPDAEEQHVGSDPEDADTDDDGLVDGQEPNGTFDMDGDGLDGLHDPDADDDGLFDGTEAGQVERARDTDPAANHWVPDEHPGTKTSPVLADTDGGGRSDGDEDLDRDGHFEEEMGECDPRNPADDSRADCGRGWEPPGSDAGGGGETAGPWLVGGGGCLCATGGGGTTGLVWVVPLLLIGLLARRRGRGGEGPT